MKKGIAVVLVLIMAGIGIRIPGNVSMAVQMEESTAGWEETTEDGTEAESEEETKGEAEESEELFREDGWGNNRYVTEEKQNEETNYFLEDEFRKAEQTGEEAKYVEAVTGTNAGIIDKADIEIVSLQIPQKMGVVIDPWEIDKRGQIYSEQFVIRNVGETAGKLILSNLTCSPSEWGEVSVRMDNNGIHDGLEKSIYMEMVFGNGDHVAFTQEGAEYEVRLDAGEELEIWFSGEVNEYASQSWKNGDITVAVEYSWDIEKIGLDAEIYEN